MKKNVLFLAVLITLSFTTQLFAEGYKIKIKVAGIKDTTAYLGNYFGAKMYVKDTIKLDSKGMGTFENKEKLIGGIYFIYFPTLKTNQKHFEFIIDQDQNFSLETDTLDLLKNLKVIGCEENVVFHDYQIYMMSNNEKLQNLSTSMKKCKPESDSAKMLQKEMDQLIEEKKAKLTKVMDDYPKSLFAKIIKAMKEPDLPKFTVDENIANKDSVLRIKNFYYMRDHWFDNIDFSDQRMLRTPVFHNKMNDYLTQMVVQYPDSIIPQVHKVIDLSKADTLVFQYTCSYLFNYYETSKIMGMDRVFVDIAERYYLTGQTKWADSTLMAKIKERVRSVKPTLIGEKAHDLKLQTYEGSIVSLNNIKAKYTVLYFWEPGCGHCKVATPKFHEFYKKVHSKGIEFLAVYTQVELEPWKEFIEKNELTDWINAYDPYYTSKFRDYYDVLTTPSVYLLDKDKKIIAKKIDVESLEKILDMKFAEEEKKDKK